MWNRPNEPPDEGDVLRFPDPSKHQFPLTQYLPEVDDFNLKMLFERLDSWRDSDEAIKLEKRARLNREAGL